MAKKQWLVKSNGRVLGPYSKDQIADYLFTRELVIIDEVCLPTGMWEFIRDQKDFSEIVEKLVVEEVNVSENTQILSTTDSITLSESVSEQMDESCDPVAGEPTDDKTEYITADETEYVYKDGEPSRVPLVVVSFFVILAFGFILYFKVLSLSEEKVKRYGALLVEGANLVHQGHFDEALIKYKEAYQLDSRTSDFHIDLGALLIRSGETVQARRVLEGVLIGDPEVKDEATLVLGLADLMDGNHGEAEKKFNEVLSSQFFLASMNKSLSFIQTGKYNEAYNLLKDLLSSQNADPLVFILLSQSRIHLWHKERDKSYLSQSLVDLRDHISSASNYYQESLLIRAYLHFLIGNKIETEFLVKRVLNTNPYQTMNFKTSVFIDNSMVAGWTVFGKWCQSIVDSMGTQMIGQALKAYCAFRDGSREQAFENIKSIVEQNPGDPLALSLYSFMLNELSDENKAFVELNKALELEPRYQLALSLRGHICETKKDMECALESWSELVRVDRNSLAGHTGLARYYLSKDETEKSIEHYEKGIHLAANYIPLLELAEKLGK